MSKKQAHETLLGIFEQPTITLVQSHCESLVDSGDYDEFEKFVESGTDFIVTERRLEILKQIEERLKTRDTPIIVLKGAYGSGKTVLMDAIEDIFESSQVYGTENIDQYYYGSDQVDCYPLSLEDYTTPYEFLDYVFKEVTNQELSTDQIIELFEERMEQVSKHDIPADLEEQARGPSSVDEVVEVLINLPPKEIVNTIEKIGEVYKEETGSYFCIYIDEFEQLSREMAETGTEPFILRLVKRLMRNAIKETYDTDKPPYLLFVNTFTFERFREELNFERDDTERLDNVSYEISLNREETVQLFKHLFRLYTLPLLADEGADDWHSRLESAQPESDDYTYPFTGKVLRYLIELVATTKEEGDEVVEAFREYKRLLVTLFSLWDPESDRRIDLEFVFQHGDSVRSELQRDTDIIQWNRFPGTRVVSEKIESDFSSVSKPEYKAVLKAVAKDATLSTNAQEYYEINEIHDISASEGINLTDAEVTQLVETASNAPYFTVSRSSGTIDRLIVKPSELIGSATGGISQPISEQIKDEIDRHDLRETSLISLWAEYAESKGQEVDILEGEYIKFDLLGSANYTKSVTVGFNRDLVNIEEDSRAYQFTLSFSELDEFEEIPLEVNAGEAAGKGSYFQNKLQEEYKDAVESHYDSEENNQHQLIARLRGALPDLDSLEIYELFLKLSLIKKLDDRQLNTDVEGFSMALSTFFSVGVQVQNIMNSGSHLTQYAYRHLGLAGEGYSAGELLDLAFAIRNLQENDSLLYEEPFDPNLNSRVWEPKNVSRANQHKHEFKEFLDDELYQETWVDAANYDLTTDYGNLGWIIDELRSHLEAGAESEDSISFENACEIIYGTDEIHGNGRVGLYIVLLVGEYNNEWDVGTEDDKPVLKHKPGIDSLRVRAKQIVNDEIEKTYLKCAREGKQDQDSIKKIEGKLETIESANSEELLSRIIDKAEPHWETNSEEVSKKLGTLAKSEVFDGDVGRYLTVLRENLSDDAETYLVLPRVKELADNLSEAREVLEIKQERDKYHNKLTSLSQGQESSVTTISISCVNELESFIDTTDWETNLEEADALDVIQDYIEDGTGISEVYSQLESLQDSIVPDLPTYDNSEHLETVTEEKDRVLTRIDKVCQERIEELDEKEDWVDNLPRDIVANQWMDKATTAISKCKKELEESPDKIDPSIVSTQYQILDEAESKLRQSFEESKTEVSEKISKYDLEMEPDELFEDVETSLEVRLNQMSEESFKQLLKTLRELDDQNANEIVRIMAQNKVISDLTVKE